MIHCWFFLLDKELHNDLRKLILPTAVCVVNLFLAINVVNLISIYVLITRYAFLCQFLGNNATNYGNNNSLGCKIENSSGYFSWIRFYSRAVTIKST